MYSILFSLLALKEVSYLPVFSSLHSMIRLQVSEWRWVRTLTVKVPLLHQTNQTKQRLEHDALLPLVSSIHQCIGTCNTFRMIAYLDFNRFPQNSIEADLVFSDFQCQLFINIEADSDFSQFLSSILQLIIQMVANKHKCIIKNKMPSIFQLIVGFKRSITAFPLFQLIDVSIPDKK